MASDAKNREIVILFREDGFYGDSPIEFRTPRFLAKSNVHPPLDGSRASALAKNEYLEAAENRPESTANGLLVGNGSGENLRSLTRQNQPIQCRETEAYTPNR